MNGREEQEIKYLQQHHFSADIISKSMKIPVEKVCDILGYPRDKAGRVAAHKDYNFYEGDWMEYYGFFLEEGDFEKWQPICYMDKTSDKFLNLRQEAYHISKSDDPRMEARRYWILQRFTTYQGKEWKDFRDKFTLKINKVQGVIVEKLI